MRFEGKIDEDNEDEDQRKSPGSIKNNLLQSWRQFRAAALFAVGQYELKLTKKFDPIQTKLLASECLAKVPSLMYCIDYLEKGADPNAIIGDGLMRPLHAVAKKSNVLLVQSLVDAGADINAQNGRNQTPLIIASDSIITESSYIAVIRYFARRANCKIELRDVGGNTALLNGIYRNNVWITRSHSPVGLFLPSSSRQRAPIGWGSADSWGRKPI
jgi:ankyrin repeat protein